MKLLNHEPGCGDDPMDLMHVEVDRSSRKLVFHKDCLEMHPVCKAMCCRRWDVSLSSEEYASGQYDSEVTCALTGKICSKTSRPCKQHVFRLSKREDKSCVYLVENRCQIYALRPSTCREFQCRAGWRLDTVDPDLTSPSDKNPQPLLKETFVDRLTEDIIFVLHPLIKLHTVFYIKQRQEILFIKEMVGGCGKFNTKDNFDFPQLDDTRIINLIDLFGQKVSLGKIYRIYCEQNPAALTLQEFFGIVWLLNKHSIVIDSTNFKGILGGIGGID